MAPESTDKEPGSFLVLDMDGELDCTSEEFVNYCSELIFQMGIDDKLSPPPPGTIR